MTQALVSDTTRAFDAHAAQYDALVEQNPLLQNMRQSLWDEVTRRVPAPARLLDLGCGTGIDAVHFATAGYTVTALDPSAEMVHQTRARATRAHASVNTVQLGAESLAQLDSEKFDAIYSDLGPLNCVAGLESVSRECAALLQPHGYLIVSVMARVCPWELAYFTLRGEFDAASRRFPRTFQPIKLGDGIVWTRYYDPNEFYQFFAMQFRLVTYRALNLLLPSPYLVRAYQRAGRIAAPLTALDARLSTLPLLHNMGDHFLMVLSPRSAENVP